MEDTDNQFAMLGFLASQVRHTSLEADSTLAEFPGITYARLWIALIAPRCPTHICTDSPVAINILNFYHRPRKYLALTNLGVSVGQYVSDSIQYNTYSLSHVSAHQDQPWNELVDSLAETTACADFAPVCLDRDLVKLVCDSPYIAWMAVTQSSNDLDAYPPCINMDFHATCISTHTGNIDMYHKQKPCDEPLAPVKDAIKASIDAIVLRTATHNVMSAVDFPGEAHMALDSSCINILCKTTPLFEHHWHARVQTTSREKGVFAVFYSWLWNH